MSEQIDWSKAPESCIGAFTSKHDFKSVGFSSFFVITKRYSDYGAQAGCSGEDADGKEYHVFEKYWDYHGKPEPWSGEGLPPVGVVCESRALRGDEIIWNIAKVIAHDNGVVIFRWMGGPARGDLCEYSLPGSFRPICTPEQIAAEKIRSEIDAMVKACPYPGSACTLADCVALYDAGYRKP